MHEVSEGQSILRDQFSLIILFNVHGEYSVELYCHNIKMKRNSHLLALFAVQQFTTSLPIIHFPRNRDFTDIRIFLSYEYNFVCAI